jgi:hypothetical protein
MSMGNTVPPARAVSRSQQALRRELVRVAPRYLLLIWAASEGVLVLVIHLG